MKNIKYNIKENRIQKKFESFFDTIIPILEKKLNKYEMPSVSTIKEKLNTPFHILISTILSARTKDETTLKVSEKLFNTIKTFNDILNYKKNPEELEKLIYPVGFYKVKAKNLISLSEIIINNYKGNVPNNLEDLLSLPGVGRKTANLVLALAFGKDGLCVDTHVHRISNRLGIIKTKNPTETEMKLRKILPLKYYEVYNRLLVTFGKIICTPISPKCSICPIIKYCKKVNVKKNR
ncbi:MAG: endonuclease III [Spirochaetes bacterium]|nr:endonuclease III [Spirochaetota bacterium]